MAQRITVTTLRAVCDTLNRRSGFPDGTKLWQRIGDRNVATVGMFTIDGAYGGWPCTASTTREAGSWTRSVTVTCQRESFTT